MHKLFQSPFISEPEQPYIAIATSQTAKDKKGGQTQTSWMKIGVLCWTSNLYVVLYINEKPSSKFLLVMLDRPEGIGSIPAYFT